MVAPRLFIGRNGQIGVGWTGDFNGKLSIGYTGRVVICHLILVILRFFLLVGMVRLVLIVTGKQIGRAHV